MHTCAHAAMQPPTLPRRVRHKTSRVNAQVSPAKRRTQAPHLRRVPPPPRPPAHPRQAPAAQCPRAAARVPVRSRWRGRRRHRRMRGSAPDAPAAAGGRAVNGTFGAVTGEGVGDRELGCLRAYTRARLLAQTRTARERQSTGSGSQ